jgi:hypothetical protein
MIPECILTKLIFFSQMQNIFYSIDIELKDLYYIIFFNHFNKPSFF